MTDSNDLKKEAVFSCVPMSLVKELRKYRTKDTRSVISWRGRSATSPSLRGSGGNVKHVNARTATLYISLKDNPSLKASLQRAQDLNRTQGIEIEDLREALSDVNDTLIDTGKELEQFKQAIKVATETIKLSNDSIKELKGALKVITKYI